MVHLQKRACLPTVARVGYKPLISASCITPSTCRWGIYPPTLLANILDIDSKTSQPSAPGGRLELEGQSSTVSPVAGLLKNNI